MESAEGFLMLIPSLTAFSLNSPNSSLLLPPTFFFFACCPHLTPFYFLPFTSANGVVDARDLRER